MSFAIVLFDDCPTRLRLYPLTLTRPIGNLRVGIYTLNQKWNRIFQVEVSYLTAGHLSVKYPFHATLFDQGYLLIKANVLPSSSLVDELKALKENQKLVDEVGDWLAIRLSRAVAFEPSVLDNAETVLSKIAVQRINYPEDIFLYNAGQIGFDLQNTVLAAIDPARYPECSLFGTAIYVDKFATLQPCTLDSRQGPIYIGEGAVVEAGAVIHGPASIGAYSRVKSGAVLYNNVTVGDYSTVCGELNNTVIWGNSAKGHLGYLGCSVVGEGCNMGAGTNNSNLRNDWKTVSLYDYSEDRMRDTGLQKCGVIIGDHVMLGIGSKINTGTVIGVGSQIAISNFIPKFVADFSWLTEGMQDKYVFKSFIAMMKRKAQIKGDSFDEADEQILTSAYEESTHIAIK